MLLIGISCAWITGIWLGSQFEIPVILILSAVLPVPFLIYLNKLRKLLLLLAVSLVFFFLGAWLSPILSHHDNLIAIYNNQDSVQFIGTVSEQPEKKGNSFQTVISIREVNGCPCNGNVLYTTYSSSNLKYGDVIQGKGYFEAPLSFADFDYRAYLANENIFSTTRKLDYRVIEKDKGFAVTAWIIELRERLADSIESALPEPQASLCQGIVLGIRNNIPPDLKNDLSVTGSAHLLAISGLNLTIIAGLLLSLGFFIFGRRYYIYAWVTLGVIWFYSLLTGLQAPVIRSASMASVFLLADIMGRQKRAFPALIFSAAIMVAFTPHILGNLSFQLSFLAMMGLIFVTPLIKSIGTKTVHKAVGEEGFWSKFLNLVFESFSVSLGAVIVIWPVIALRFQIVSFVGPLTTFIISPALTPIIVLGSLTAFVGLFSSTAAQYIGWITWLFLSYMIVIAWAFAALPLAYLKTKNFNMLFIWLYSPMLVLLVNFKAVLNKIKINRYKAIRSYFMDWGDLIGNAIGRNAKWIMPPLLIISILTSLAAVTMPGRDLTVSFLNVGEGESILIQKEGQNILIDGGPSDQSVCLELGKALPFWERKIDLLILTHPHLDHLTGLLEVLKRYRVEKILASPIPSDLPIFKEWLQVARSKDIEYITAQSGQQIMLNSGAILDILNPHWFVNTDADPDENAIVARLSYGIHSILFTSDIGNSTETRMMRDRVVSDSDIIKIGHHGSNNSTSDLFLKAVNPFVAIISVGANNQFGHPDKAVLERISVSGIRNIYRTDLNGTITLRIGVNDPAIRIITERK